MARPEKPQNERKTESLHVRLTAEEMAAIRAAAARERRTAADYARIAILQKAGK